MGQIQEAYLFGVPREEERDRVAEKYLMKQWSKFVQIQLKLYIHRRTSTNLK